MPTFFETVSCKVNCTSIEFELAYKQARKELGGTWEIEEMLEKICSILEEKQC